MVSVQLEPAVVGGYSFVDTDSLETGTYRIRIEFTF